MPTALCKHPEDTPEARVTDVTYVVTHAKSAEVGTRPVLVSEQHGCSTAGRIHRVQPPASPAAIAGDLLLQRPTHRPLLCAESRLATVGTRTHPCEHAPTIGIPAFGKARSGCLWTHAIKAPRQSANPNYRDRVRDTWQACCVHRLHPMGRPELSAELQSLTVTRSKHVQVREACACA